MFETMNAQFVERLIDSNVNHRMFLEDPWVREQAQEIASNTFARNEKKGSSRRDWRTIHQIYEDSLNGLALQMAVVTYLRDIGVDARMENDRKEWDIIVCEDGDEYHIDVKGIFKENANNWCQTWWEANNVPLLGHNIWYLCFDCRDDTEDVYEGYCTQNDFKDSKYGTPPYVSRHMLTL